ncbi:AIM24 family protein [Nocardia sp. 348MFTsu5.1]|uniref:AIM24 family protein n=1 Tax=Nocardia sp. 348MFTsu5.1 TaxID=1172185 RepID=UPI0012DF0F18|nr:AIM24 family protein [Nocardia sp. 348MFTsu5.1]
MRELAPGENTPLPSPLISVSVTCASPVNTSAVLLTPAGRVRSDDDLIFYNQAFGPGVAYSSDARSDIITIDTSRVPAGIETIAITASLDGTGPTTFATAGTLRAELRDGSGRPTVAFTPGRLTSESALVCMEVYRRGDAWKVRAVGQGYDDGLAGLATAFGIQVDDDPGTTPPTPDPMPWPPAGQSAPPAPPPQPAYTQTSAQTPPPAQPQHQGVPAMNSDLFAPAHAEVTGSGIQKQGSKMCRVGMNGEIMARTGSMVAYQGNLHFEAQGSGGISRAIRNTLTGEGVPLMKVTGQGDLFLADAASDVHLIDLDGSDGLTINGANVLAFDSTLTYDVKRVQGAGAQSNAGLFNCVFTGRGRIAITTDGNPVVLTVDQQTFADPNAAVAWSSSLQTSIKRNDSFNLGTLMGRSTGERFTLAFSGQGFVVVQPSELPPGGFIGGTGGGSQSGVSGGLGGLLGR